MPSAHLPQKGNVEVPIETAYICACAHACMHTLLTHMHTGRTLLQYFQVYRDALHALGGDARPACPHVAPNLEPEGLCRAGEDVHWWVLKQQRAASTSMNCQASKGMLRFSTWMVQLLFLTLLPVCCPVPSPVLKHWCILCDSNCPSLCTLQAMHPMCTRPSASTQACWYA